MNGDRLRALARKYRELGELRRAKTRDGSVASREVFQALAHEFPGALRELDTLPLEEIDRRAVVLDRASAGGAIEPWMEWMAAYHAVMRAALATKRRWSGEDALAGAPLEEMAEDATRMAGVEIRAADIEAIGRPPAGRISVVVFDVLARTFGVAAEEIWEVLFPARRKGRWMRRGGAGAGDSG